MMFDTLFWKKLAKEEQRTVSGWSGVCIYMYICMYIYNSI